MRMEQGAGSVEGEEKERTEEKEEKDVQTQQDKSFETTKSGTGGRTKKPPTHELGVFKHRHQIDGVSFLFLSLRPFFVLFFGQLHLSLLVDVFDVAPKKKNNKSCGTVDRVFNQQQRGEIAMLEC